MRVLLLLGFFMLAHFCAHAQQVRPKWVDNLKENGLNNSVTCLTVDKQNNIYVTGQFTGTIDMDPSTGVKNLISVGDQDVFIGKYTQNGTLIWAESVGGTGTETPNGISVDKDGNVSIAGSFNSATLDADPGSGIFDLYNPYAGNGNGGTNGFIIHLDTNGNFLWANSLVLGSPITSADYRQVASDSEDDVVVTSGFEGSITIGDSTYISPPPSGSNFEPDGLIVKYGPTGNLLWSLHLHDNQTSFGFAIVPYDVRIDSQDNILISGGYAGSANFNPFGTPYYLTADASYALSSFIVKYAPSGILTWINNINEPMGGAGAPNGMCLDQQDNVYFSKQFQGTLNFGSVSIVQGADTYYQCLVKYSSAGVLQFAKSFTVGGNVNRGINFNLSSDQNNNIYLAGAFKDTINFNLNSGTPDNLITHGYQDFFVVKYDDNGNYLHGFNCGPTNLNSSSSVMGSSVAVDNDNNIVIGGVFSDTVNFDPTNCSTDTVSTTSSFQWEGFFAQYNTITVANNVITPPTISSFCTSGTPAAITGNLPTGGSGAYTYQWLSSADSVTFAAINGATGQNYTPPTLTATTYYERVVSSDTCTTPSESNVVKITISNPPAAPVVASDTNCNGSTATLSVTSPQTGATYNWYADTTSTTSLFTGTSFTTPALTTTTTYYVAATNSTGCISATRAAAMVTILPTLAVPVVTLASATASSVIFTWTAVPGATGYQVSTDGGQTYTPHAGLTDTISGLQAGQSATITVQAIGSIACQLSAASAAVTGQTVDVIYVANAFTPNGDGRNDVLHVLGANIQSLKFYIYDQWGEQIFSTTSQQNGWDGTYKGTKEPVGVYVYSLEAVMNDGTSVKKKGTVTLLK